MKELVKTDGKQTVKGKFSPGNKIGKQFPKGSSGNPNGRPKLTKLTEALREQLAEEMPNAPERTVAEAIARALIKEAVSGNVLAIREIGDRTEGKPKQAIDLEMNIKDWRDLARDYGLTEQDVYAEAKLIIEQSDFNSSGE
jgi:hypothetical protein